MELKSLEIHKNLKRRTRSRQAAAICFKDPIVKFHSRRSVIDKRTFNDDFVPVTERLLKITMHRNNRNSQALVIKIEVGNTILLAECFAPIFKVADVMPVPDNSQGIRFVKADRYFFFISKQGYSVKRISPGNLLFTEIRSAAQIIISLFDLFFLKG